MTLNCAACADHARFSRCAGHLLGAAGAVEAVATVMALQTGMVRVRCGVVLVCAGGARASGVSCGCTDAPYCRSCTRTRT